MLRPALRSLACPTLRRSGPLLKMAPPVLAKKPHAVKFGVVPGEDRGDADIDPPIERNDDYFWVRDDERKNPEVLDHLKAENEYFEQQMAPIEGMRAQLFEEMKGHMKEDDTSAPAPRGEYEYFHHQIAGKAYKVHCRRRRGDASSEEVVLDVNKVAEGLPHCDVLVVRPSPSQRLVAYSLDSSGNETYTIRVIDVSSGEVVEEVLTGVYGDVTWGKDDSTLYYRALNAQLSPFQIWRHKIGGKKEEDELLFEEKDSMFIIGDVEKTLSGKYILTTSESKETTEVCVIDLQDPEAKFRVLVPRREGVLVKPGGERGGRFYLLTNADGAQNFKVVEVPVGSTGPEDWVSMEGMVPEGNRMFESLEVFSTFLALVGREEGLTRAWTHTFDSQEKGLVEVAFEEPGEVDFGRNYEYEAPHVRLSFSSFVSPARDFDYDPASKASSIVKVTEVPNFDPSLYQTCRITAKVRDGVEVPVFLIWRKDRRSPPTEGGQAGPLMLYGYGSYGINIDPRFQTNRLPYLDRGVVYAEAQIRGGSEMGRYWYEDEGKYLAKKNTFQDFCDVAESLVASGWTTPDRLAISGRSAGGLLMGAVLNLRPDLFRAAAAGVPFVDLMCTMCDASIPLTTEEWPEWGNPNTKKYHDYMLSYSPVDNVREGVDYPALYIQAGLHDPRVPYWEPTKWLGHLRSKTPYKLPMVMRMDLDSGHFSASDRYKYIRENSYEIAFVLDQLGVGNGEGGDPQPSLVVA